MTCILAPPLCTSQVMMPQDRLYNGAPALNSTQASPKGLAPTSAATRPRGRRKRTISFNKRVTVRPTLHLNDYTDKEFAACFYTREEYADIQDDIHEDLDLLENGQFLEDVEGKCKRGIELSVQDTAYSRYEYRQFAVYTVLSIQQYFLSQQKSRKFPSHDFYSTIASLYSQAATAGRNTALRRGLADEAAARL